MSDSNPKPCQYRNDQWVRLLKVEMNPKATQEEKAAAKVAVQCLWEDLFTFCVYRANFYSQDEQFAQDAAVDSYYRILRAIDQNKFESKGPFLNFCRVVAHNRIKSLLRPIIRRRKHETDFPEDDDGGGLQ